MWRLAMRNAGRNPRRSALTAATVLVGTALTTVTLALLGGIFGGIIEGWTAAFGHVRIVDREYLAREILSPLYENIEEAEPILARVRAVPGVLAAEPRIVAGVVLAAGEEIGEDYAQLVGASEAYYRDHFGVTEKLVRGVWLAKGDEVVLGRRIAAQLGAELGQEILVLGQTQYGSMSPISAKLVGVVAGDSMIDVGAFVSLETARWLVDLPDGAIELLVYGEDPEVATLAPVVAALRAAVPGLAAVPWYEHRPWAASLPMIEGTRYVISLVLLFVMILAIFNTMTMSVMERTREIGVLRALGQTRAVAVGLFLVEAITIGLAGGALGAGLGSLGGLYLERRGIHLAEDLVNEVATAYPMSTVLRAHLDAEVVLTALTVGLLTAILGAVLPAMRAAHVQPYEAMRSKR